jgi:hypothetical protein
MRLLNERVLREMERRVIRRARMTSKTIWLNVCAKAEEIAIRRRIHLMRSDCRSSPQ